MAEFVIAGSEDVSLLSKLGNTIFSETYADILSKEQIEYMLEMMYSTQSLQRQMLNNNTFYIVFNQGEACGYIAIEDKGESLLHLQKLYLRNDMRGKGIGKEMMQKVFAHAKELYPKGATITLNVNRKNPTLEFYKKTGWSVIECGDFDLGCNFYANDYIMRIEV